MTTPSANTLAVLLLTSPLLQEGGKGSGKDPVLTAVEYAQLAAVLHRKQHQPSDLINGSRQSLLGSLSSEFAAERLDRLLSRGFQLSQAVEHWANRSISVVGRADSAYPRRFKQRLKHAAPPLLYACGNLALLNAPALAVVGSRNTPEPQLQQAEAVGALAAAAGVVLASGAAKGVDETAMLGSLAAGGCAIGVVADSLEKVSARPIWRQALVEGRLLLLSSDTPSARFQVWRAMARNKLIYALADAALVVSSAKGEGGTWTGAMEQLQKLQFCPLHVLNDPRGGAGLAALAETGAQPWSNPASPEALLALLRETELPQATTPATAPAEMEQGSLLESALIEPPQPRSHSDVAAEVAPGAVVSLPKQLHPISTREEVKPPAVALAAFVDDLLLQCLEQPYSIDELAMLLEVSKAEVKRWCLRLAEQGRVRRLSRPVRYVRHGLPG
jgi:DNA processing protein